MAKRRKPIRPSLSISPRLSITRNFLRNSLYKKDKSKKKKSRRTYDSSDLDSDSS
jgi:hypothetical protein